MTDPQSQPQPKPLPGAGQRIAVIGTGYWGKNLVRTFANLGVLRTVCDASRECLDRLQVDSAVRRTTQFEEVLQDPEVSAVAIATPASSHFELVRSALQAGKDVFVDGLGVGDVSHVVLRDRQLLSQDGIATIVIAIDAQTGKPMGEPELVTRGIVFGPEGEQLMAEARARIAKTLAKTAREGATDQAVIKNAVRESLSGLLWERIRRRPMIIPVVMEV